MSTTKDSVIGNGVPNPRTQSINYHGARTFSNHSALRFYLGIKHPEKRYLENATSTLNEVETSKR